MENKRVFIKAQSGPSKDGDPESMFTVHYFDTDGNVTIRSSGSRAWRCNNPGNLRKSPYSTGTSRRSIGTAGHGDDIYPVYPDYQTGHEALVVMLRGSVYSPLTLRAAMIRYDGTNPKYIDEIAKITGFNPERTIKSLSDAEFEKFWKAIEQVEKWIVGREDFIEKLPISGVHKVRNVISEYLVGNKNDKIWIDKKDAIKLACEHRLHAIIVHLKNGTVYLRPPARCKSFELIPFGKEKQ